MTESVLEQRSRAADHLVSLGTIAAYALTPLAVSSSDY
jgi:hypothetical protein